MFYQVTRQNHAKSHPDFAGKAMPVLITTILEIVAAARENSATDQHLVLMLSTVMNGESRQIVKVEIIVHIVTQEPNNSFILRYTSRQNVMICNKLAIAPGDPSVLLLM